MTVTNGYTTLDELKFVLDITDATDDTRLERTIERVSRWIDNYTHRRFYSTDEARYFTAQGPRLVELKDCLSISSLETDDNGDRTFPTTWQPTDYDLMPLNAQLDGEPFDHLIARINGDYYFPSYDNAVKVTGAFGYSASTPDTVEEACLIQCHRMWKRKDAPFGVSGPNTFGQQQILTKLDPDVQLLLDMYVRPL